MMKKATKAKVKTVAKKLRGASKAHAGQAKVLEGLIKKNGKKKARA